MAIGETAQAAATPGAAAAKPLSSNELAQIRTDLGVERTVMAADRSLMAWLRTALSMISFGFTIYKVLEGFEKGGQLVASGTPRTVGLFLIGLGTVAMVMGTIEYWVRLRSLEHLHPMRLAHPTFIMALIMSLAGTFLFIAVISHLL
jgi:putative membrane protein